MITRCIEKFVSRHPERGKAFVSLGQLRYLSLLKHAAVMVGNSSSGIIEAPSFELPVVNIGDRQQGRIRARNVIEVAECRRAAIARAITTAVSEEFRNALQGLQNPYGTGATSERILAELKVVPLGTDLLKKTFYHGQPDITDAAHQPGNDAQTSDAAVE